MCYPPERAPRARAPRRARSLLRLPPRRGAAYSLFFPLTITIYTTINTIAIYTTYPICILYYTKFSSMY